MPETADSKTGRNVRETITGSPCDSGTTLRASSVSGWIRPLMNSMTPRGMVSRVGTFKASRASRPSAAICRSHLVQEKRVALSHIVQSADQRRVGREAPGALDELADGTFVKAEQRSRRAKLDDVTTPRPA